jgi:hypothetical protein
MSVSDELVQANAEYAKRFDRGGLPLPPARRLASQRKVEQVDFEPATRRK